MAVSYPPRGEICWEGSQEGQTEGLLLSPGHWWAPPGTCGWAQLGRRSQAVAGTALCSSLSQTLVCSGSSGDLSSPHSRGHAAASTLGALGLHR